MIESLRNSIAKTWLLYYSLAPELNPKPETLTLEARQWGDRFRLGFRTLKPKTLNLKLF